jgi:hypothetical protein
VPNLRPPLMTHGAPSDSRPTFSTLGAHLISIAPDVARPP